MEGAQVLSAWADRDLDAIVATSAFGLGVDQGDVRAVLHACVPETVDRFYQEVGRGGRDGKASISLVVHAPGDTNVARSLSRRRVIGIERGLKRWRTMFQSWQPVANRTDSYTVSLEARHSEIIQDSEANVAWNARTLILMARAGLIALESPPVPELRPQPEESETAFEQRCRESLSRYALLASFRLIDEGHSNEDVWSRCVESFRQESMRADREAFAQMLAILEGTAPVSDIFREVYTIESLSIFPAGATGSCPWTRRTGRNSRDYVASHPAAVKGLDFPVKPRFVQALPSPDPQYWIGYEAPTYRSEREQWRRQILSLLQRAVAAGILEIAAASHWLQDPTFQNLYTHSLSRFIVNRDLAEPDDLRLDGKPTALALPRLSLVDPDARELPVHLLEVDRPLHIIVVPAEIHDVDRPDRPLLAVRDKLSLDRVLYKISA